jgi:hypothetical protein
MPETPEELVLQRVADFRYLHIPHAKGTSQRSTPQVNAANLHVHWLLMLHRSLGSGLVLPLDPLK